MSESGERDEGGRFVRGNKGGPGNPYARKTAELRKAAADSVSREEVAEIVGVLKAKARGGDVAAARLLFSYAIGRPAEPAHPDGLDADEVARLAQDRPSGEQAEAVMRAPPAWMLLTMADVALPSVHARLCGEAADALRGPDEWRHKNLGTPLPPRPRKEKQARVTDGVNAGHPPKSNGVYGMSGGKVTRSAANGRHRRPPLGEGHPTERKDAAAPALAGR